MTSKMEWPLFRCRLLYLPLMLLQPSLLAGGWRLAGLLLDVWHILQSKSKIIYRQWYNYMVSFGKHFLCTSACLRASLFIFYRVFIACSSWCVKFSRRLVFRILLETKIMFASRWIFWTKDIIPVWSTYTLIYSAKYIFGFIFRCAIVLMHVQECVRACEWVCIGICRCSTIYSNICGQYVHVQRVNE